MCPSSLVGCGEALLKAGKTDEAPKLYRKSVELNPKSEHGIQVIEQLSGMNCK
jgi:hypothetical protein